MGGLITFLPLLGVLHEACRSRLCRVSDWTWEYSPDAAHVVGGLAPEQVAVVDALAQRIADAVAVRRIGVPVDEQEAASDLKTYGEGSVLLWYQE